MRIAFAVMVVVSAVGLVAQEGAATLPSNYKIQFENAWVKVTSVRYEGRQKLPGHTHTPNPAAYVYLNDGPPVIFSHVGGKPATRPATKAGAFRIYRGLVEVHEVENTGAAPSEFLRVELKTTPVEPGSFFGKYERPASPAADPVVHFNHPQLRVTRLWIQPNQELPVTATSEPALVIALAPGTGVRTGETKWVAPSTTERLKNTSAVAIDVLRFDLRTPPRATR